MVALANPQQTNQKTKDKTKAPEGGREWDSVRLAATSRRRWKWAVLATALIAGGGMAGAWAGFAGQDTAAVAVLAADLPAGHVITAADLTSVEAVPSEGLRLLAPDTVEGMALARPMPAGSPLVAGAVSDSALWPQNGAALVAVPVAALPQGLEAGTTVDLLSADGGAREAAENDEGAVVTALVHRVVAEGGDGFGPGGQAVEVVVSREEASRVAGAVAAGEVQVAVVNPHEQAPDQDGESGE
ncbi:SAF domain-containing protein [Nocardiopsis alba]|uniref:SAF domain-containing protein n=1 Tax=Nocardiopsis alba TaxID=53437 RepID=UPI0033DE0D62